ncbi:MAG: hypothetical protein KF760_14555 [Candidatus Eremiobacteraeota bacterium]|nr:hypothetical protein [Candidatus Eremiobacteraeota bacterium]MCW5868308.1 hypothetical protein [Candidatus Eremiobacteraeota bacterium]
MKIQQNLNATPTRGLPVQIKSDPNPSPPPQDGYQPGPPGLLQKAGGRLVHGLKNAGVNALLASTALTVPLAVTSAVSAAIPLWVPLGGFLTNLLMGGMIGAGIGKVAGDKLVQLNGLEGKAAADERFGAMTFGAALGAIGGFGGIVATPGAIIHDPGGLAMMGGATLASSTALAASWGLAQGVWQGPPR